MLLAVRRREALLWFVWVSRRGGRVQIYGRGKKVYLPNWLGWGREIIIIIIKKRYFISIQPCPSSCPLHPSPLSHSCFFLSFYLSFVFCFLFLFFFRGQLIHNQMQQSGRARAIRLDKRNADLERENDRLRHLYRLLGEMPETEAREVLRRVRAAEDPLAVLNYSRCSFFFFSRTLSYIISFFLLRLLSPLSLRLCVCVSGLLMDGPSSRPKGLNQA